LVYYTLTKLNLRSRSNVIVGFSTFIIFPLCLLKNLDALKYSSIVGIAGIIYCTIFMAIRYFDGSYAVGGKFYKTIVNNALLPSFNVKGTQFTSAIFILLSMMSTAYVAHYNAPRFWNGLKNPTLKRYNFVVNISFGFSFLMYLAVMWLGFLTFGGHSTGFILNNYSSQDPLATIARFAIGAGILGGYPLTFTALRDGILDMLGVTDTTRRNQLTLPVTVTTFALITSIALVLKNVGLVVAFSGALIGAMLIYSVPAIMNICNIRNSSNGKTQLTTSNKLELLVNYFIVFMGVGIAAVGGYSTLKGAKH